MAEEAVVQTPDIAGEVPAEEPSLRETIEQAVEETSLAAETSKMEKPAPGGRIRDESGRFTSQKPDGESPQKEAASGVAVPSAARPAGVTPPGAGPSSPAPGGSPVSEGFKPPASWRPVARDLWKTLPPDIQQEVVKREGEMQRMMQDTASARQAVETIANLMAPYQTFIEADGSNPLDAINNYLQTAARLRIGTAVEKAQTVAQIISHYGIDVRALDAILTGQMPQGVTSGYAQAQPATDPRIDALLQAEQERREKEAQREQAFSRWQEQQAISKVEEFGKTRDVWNEEIKSDMADWMEVMEKRGVDITLEDAYNRAVRMNDKYRAVVEQKEAARVARNAQSSTARARAAASSVKTSPATTVAKSSSGGSLRETLEEVVQESYGR